MYENGLYCILFYVMKYPVLKVSLSSLPSDFSILKGYIQKSYFKREFILIKKILTNINYSYVIEHYHFILLFVGQDVKISSIINDQMSIQLKDFCFSKNSQWISYTNRLLYNSFSRQLVYDIHCVLSFWCVVCPTRC